MSRNMRKLCPKVRNGQNLPHESPNFRNNLFLSNFTDNLVQKSETTLLNIFLYSKLLDV